MSKQAQAKTDAEQPSPSAVAATAPMVPIMQKYLPNNLRPAEAARAHYAMVAPDGWTIEEIFEPSALWMAGNNKLQPGSIVSITSPSYTWHVDLMVTKIDRETQNVFTQPIHIADWRKRSEQFADMTDAVVEFRAGGNRWCVIKGMSVVKNGFDTEEEAVAWVAKKSGKGTTRPAAA